MHKRRSAHAQDVGPGEAQEGVNHHNDADADHQHVQRREVVFAQHTVIHLTADDRQAGREDIDRDIVGWQLMDSRLCSRTDPVRNLVRQGAGRNDCW